MACMRNPDCIGPCGISVAGLGAQPFLGEGIIPGTNSLRARPDPLQHLDSWRTKKWRSLKFALALYYEDAKPIVP